VVAGVMADLDGSLGGGAMMAVDKFYEPYMPSKSWWADLYQEMVRDRGEVDGAAEFERRFNLFTQVYEELSQPQDEQTPTAAR